MSSEGGGTGVVVQNATMFTTDVQTQGEMLVYEPGGVNTPIKLSDHQLDMSIAELLLDCKQQANRLDPLMPTPTK